MKIKNLLSPLALPEISAKKATEKMRDNKFSSNFSKFLSALSVSVVLFFSSCSDSGQKGGWQMPPASVKVAPVTQKDVTIYLETVGNTFAPQVVRVRPQVSGMLLSFHGVEGQMVQKGDILYTVDPKPFKTALDRAKATLAKDEASLEYAKARFDKHKDLAEKGYVSKLSMDEYRTSILSNEALILMDKADIETAEIDLNHTTICSPIDGVLGLNKVDPGNCVMSSQDGSLIEIRQVAPIDVRFSLSQKDFQAIQKHLLEGNMRFEFAVNGSEELIRTGEIYFIDHHLDPSNGTILIKGEIPNTDKALWPGVFGEVKLMVKTIPNALVVPHTAIQRGQKGKFVYVVKPESSVEVRYVSVGDVDGDDILVLEGLQAGESVVTEGQMMLRDGAPVAIVDKPSPQLL